MEFRHPTIREFAAAREQWVAFFDGRIAECPLAQNVLYVCAVPNENITVTFQNDIPSGIGLNNVISVGGIDSECLFDRANFSARGHLVNVAAPATNVPVMRSLGGGAVEVVSGEGTSFAAPMITSMAAIMYAVRRPSSPDVIKSFFQDDDNVWPADSSVGGRRPSLIKTVGRYILQHGNISGAQAILDTFGGSNGNPDPSGFIMNSAISTGTSNLMVMDELGDVVAQENDVVAEYDESDGRFVDMFGEL